MSYNHDIMSREHDIRSHKESIRRQYEKICKFTDDQKSIEPDGEEQKHQEREQLQQVINDYCRRKNLKQLERDQDVDVNTIKREKERKKQRQQNCREICDTLLKWESLKDDAETKSVYKQTKSYGKYSSQQYHDPTSLDKGESEEARLEALFEEMRRECARDAALRKQYESSF